MQSETHWGNLFSMNGKAGDRFDLRFIETLPKSFCLRISGAFFLRFVTVFLETENLRIITKAEFTVNIILNASICSAMFSRVRFYLYMGPDDLCVFIVEI